MLTNELATYYSTVEQLTLLRHWVTQRLPFCHVRFNDGEFNAMFDLTKVSSPEHHYLPGVGENLLRAFNQIVDTLRNEPVRMIVGSYWYASPKHDGAPRFMYYMDKELGINPRLIPWGMSDLWYSEGTDAVGGDEITQLIDAVRTQSRRVLLVANSRVAGACKCLGAEFLEVPPSDCWLQREHILKIGKQYAERGATFIWCAGLPAKIWAWDLYDEFPQSSHIDAGHLFDGVFGIRSRAWLGRRQGPHWELYRDKFIPYVKGFIK